MADLGTILVTALTTLLIALVAALVASRLQANREQANWLRDQRHEVCSVMLKSIDWRDLAQKVDAERPKSIDAPVDLYAKLDILGLDTVTDAARSCEKALLQLEMEVKPGEQFDSDLYRRLQDAFDRTRRNYVETARRALGIEPA